jgi:hypothetical protein
MRTEKAFGPFAGVSGGGDGEEGAGDKACPMEVIGLALDCLLPFAGESRQVLMCFWIT